MNYDTRITQLTIVPNGEALFHHMATIIEISDEAGGEYLTIKQFNDRSKPGEIEIDDQLWPTLRGAIDRMFEEIESHPQNTD
jgi:hypothetical protein